MKFEYPETLPVCGLYPPANFNQQPKVVDGASFLLVEVLGNDRDIGARSAIGTNDLPGISPLR
ncbi:MAG: hypothetical protein AB9907_17050 [Flexilinea sp.]